MALQPIQHIVLSEIRKQRFCEIADMIEPWRQCVIDLGMMDPPLVEVDGPIVSITGAGLKALTQ